MRVARPRHRAIRESPKSNYRVKFPLVWRTTLEQERQQSRASLAEQRALVERLQEKLQTAKADLAEAEQRAVVPKTVRRDSETAIREMLTKRGVQGEALDRATREIVEQGMRTLGRLG